MIIHHKFLENENLLVQKAFGEWSTEYYIKYIDEVFKQKEMLNVKKIFSDLRDINLEKAFKDLDLLIALRNKMIKLDYLSVVLIDNPMSTTVTHLYQERVISEGYDHTYCSTMKKAFSLLSLNMSENEMEDILNKIERPS